MGNGHDHLTTRSVFPLGDMNGSMKIVEPEIALSDLLELAAYNDVEGFKRLSDSNSSATNEVGLWYGHQRSSKRMLMEHRTPLMIAATYGSLDVVKFILSLSETDVNTSCGSDKTTALHCAASGGSPNAFDVIKILLDSGADVELVDANGCRPIDVVFVPPNQPKLKMALESLLLQKGDDSALTSVNLNLDNVCIINEKKEYPIDPCFPDLQSDTYSSDEFRMFAFKIRPCSRAYSHDWTECPFIHPGESARRRDPRKIHYSCVPCPDFKKGQCRFRDLCEFSHGVFECWLHPAQYRTRLCKDGTFCARRVCFFAHKPEELRPLHVSTGSALPSPRGSPAGANAMSPPPFSPPPMLQLHGANFQGSRLNLPFNARDIHLLDLEMHRRQHAAAFSPLHKPVVFNQSSPMSPYSPYGISSPRIMSPRDIEQSHMIPFSPHLSKWGSSKGNVDWSVNGSEMVQTRRSESSEPDVSWVQSLVKEPVPPMTPKGSGMELPEVRKMDHAALGTWLENLQLDQIVA
uniref:zinc finger CCCH domain-containing protein 30-like n=1 Tax=Erigeron canadensis TaxID=72917 RepID=UPI001CB99553|nr:zinc finger CCCH domain-containing protein 30-like [Erigeron canadensis]